jgi:hypothetical protein
MTESERPVRQVQIVNVNMPFMAMVGLVVKFWISTAVAALVLFVCSALAMALFVALVGKH